MPSKYSIYGLCVAYPGGLPGPLHAPESATIDVAVDFVTRSDPPLSAPYRTAYVSGEIDENGEPRLICLVSESGEYHCFRYSDGIDFHMDRAGRRIWIDNPRQYPADYLATYLLGPVLGFVQRLRGTVCLHASAVRIGSSAFLLAGPGGYGKSTTAAALIRHGCAVLTEDVAPIIEDCGRFLVQSGYPSLRLCPDSVQALYGAPDALPRLTPLWDKCGMPLHPARDEFHSGTTPISTIYILGERSSAPAAPFIETLPPAEALRWLIGNTYNSYALTPAMRATEFDLLGRLVRNIPVRRVIPHTDFTALTRLCAALIEDFCSGPHLNAQSPAELKEPCDV